MMNIKLLLPVAFIALISLSCKKETRLKTDESITFKPNNYYPMSVGSYWVYEYRSYSSEGEEVSDEPRIDTLKVIGDTLINNQTFFAFENNYPYLDNVYYRRDSAGYIINQRGDLILPPAPTGIQKHCETSSTDPSSGDVISKFWKEFPALQNVDVPVGNFSALEQTVYHYQKMGGTEINVSDTLYYSSIGQIQTGFSYIFGGRVVGRLTAYQLE